MRDERVVRRFPTVVDGNLVTRLQRLRHIFGQIRRRVFRPPEIDRVHYDRLTEHYRSLHALCKLLLLGRGLEHESGCFPMGSFLVDMNALFESYVTRWFVEGEGLRSPEDRPGVPVMPKN